MGTPVRTYVERERGDGDISDLGPTSQIRRALFRGERLTSDEAMERFDVGRTALGQVIRNIELLGYRYAREQYDVRNHTPAYRYWLTNPEHVPSDDDYERYRVAHADKKARTVTGRAIALRRQRRLATVAVEQAEPPPTPETPPPLNGHGVPLPAFASELRVYLLAEQEDGSVTIGLRSGRDRWLASLTGFTRVTD